MVSYAKNYLAVHFKLDYVNADGDISNYYPDFIVKLSDRRIVIVETKGQEDLDVPLKMARLRQWCEDINRVQTDVKYDFVYVDEESFREIQAHLIPAIGGGIQGVQRRAAREGGNRCAGLRASAIFASVPVCLIPKASKRESKPRRS